ncbi:histidine kinase [uncultured Microbacterium sp.]|uniref:sensor histidine kinase n=1 Tax=uncultured Microbacterium sp. TaxID=191216 RepID=UPI0026239D82|nr:histidine kinase [uncultured Microbacterium sp.]
MTNPTSIRRRITRRGWSVLLVVLGSLFDLCAVVNVPGGAALAAQHGGEVTITGFGAVLGLLSFVAWMSVPWRRRHPLVVLIAGGVIALIGISYLLLLVGAVSTIRRHPDRLRPVSAGVIAVVAIFVIRETVTPWWGAALPWFAASSADRSGIGWAIASVVLAVASLTVTGAVVLSSRAQQRAALSRGIADAERERADVLGEEMVRQAERERIARDMHDALAHRLSVVSLHAGALEMVAGDDAGGMARTVREQAHAALDDMRGLIGDLRTGPGQASPSTMRAIGPLLAETRAAGAVIASYVLIESPERAGAQFDSAVHRIVQESLTNALKHAASAPIDVHVQVDPSGGARIRVVNPLVDGGRAAAPVVPGGGHGVLGIRERAAALGGTAWIGPYEGSFIVDVTLPWQERVAGSSSGAN